MDVQLNPDLEIKLVQRATREGMLPSEFVADIVARFFDEEDRFFEAIKRGEAALGRGEWVIHEGAGERLRRFLGPQ
jgi:predicted transcriptional regulator